MTPMQTVRVVALLVISSLITGCGRTGKTAGANGQSDGHKQVSKWIFYPKSAVGIPKGLVLEKQGGTVTAVMYDLKDGPGFLIDRQIAAGKYLPVRKAFVLPLGLFPVSTVEDWIALNGTRFEIPVGSSSTNLIATFKSPGVTEFPLEFFRFTE